MDDTEKIMIFSYITQSILNQDKILEKLYEDDSSIVESYRKNNYAISHFFTRRTTDLQNDKKSDDGGGK